MRVVIAAILLLFVSTVSAQTDTRVATGVLDLESSTIPAAELRVLSDRLRAELFNTGRFRIIERERMDAILREQEFQLSGCTATECVVQIGELIGVQKMVAGSVGKIGDVYSITLRIINVETGAVERTAVQDCRCTLQELLTSNIALAAAELAAGAPATMDVGGGFGVLFVNSIPSGAHIYLNGTLRREQTPATIARLRAGEHVLRLELDSLVAEQRVRVLRDEVAKATLELRPRLETGSIFLTSDPPEATVTLDGVPVGTTPLMLRDTRTGTHRIVISRADYLPVEQEVVVRLNERTPVSAALAACGYLDVQVAPTRTARIHLDERELGQTESRLTLPVGSYHLTASAAGYDTLRRAVNIAHGQTARVRETLVSIYGGVRITSLPSGAAITSTPAGIRGVTPFAGDSVLHGSYGVHASIAGRLPAEFTVTVEKGKTSTYHVGIPEDPQIVRARRVRLKAYTRWTTLALGVAAAGFGVKWNADAGSAYDDMRAAYTKYRAATTTADATLWHTESAAAADRGDRTAGKRNVAYTAAGALLSVSLVLTVR